MRTMQDIALVFVGSGLGGVARFLLSRWITTTVGSVFPYGTLAVNTIGSFLISVVMYVSLNSQAISPNLRLFLTTGVLGGFTTYSSFNYETIALLREGMLLTACINIGATVIICGASGLLGVMTGRWLA